MPISDVDVFIPFYTCEEAREKHLYLLKQCIESVKRQGVKRICVIDGSSSTLLKSEEIDAEILRNEKHGLAFAVNIAIENTHEDLFLTATASILGVDTIKNLVKEKETAEEQLDKPVALVAPQVCYPTQDPVLLQAPGVGAGSIETVKKELESLGFRYTEQGIAIAKEPTTEWKNGSAYASSPACALGAGYLANKDRLFQIGGSDERCGWMHGDYDMAMRWISFGWFLIQSESVRIHRISATADRFCPERKLAQIGTFCSNCGCDLKTTNATKCPVCSYICERPVSFGAWMKWIFQCSLIQLWTFGNLEPLRRTTSLYRESLRPFYKIEYDSLRIKPIFLGRKDEGD